MAKQTNMDMINGPLTGKIIRFAVPLMLSGMLQLLYNAADVIVDVDGKEFDQVLDEIERKLTAF